MYYNFRFYDPSIGRFISPDDRIFPDKISGMNRYAYVNGNPIMINDPTGHKGNAWVHMANQIVKNVMGGFNLAFKEWKYQKQMQVENAIRDRLYEIAGDDPVLGFMLNANYSAKMQPRKQNKFARSSVGKALGWVNPLNLAGGVMGVAGWAFGRATGRDSRIKQVDGGYVFTNNVFGAGGGITYGHFALVGGNRETAIRHETAHLQQYNDWGAVKYYSHLGISPVNNIFQLFGRGRELGAENDADRRAGTWGGGYEDHESQWSDYLKYYSLISLIKIATSDSKNLRPEIINYLVNSEFLTAVYNRGYLP